MAIAYLIDRGVIRISGPDARSFLHNVTTGDVAAVSPECAGFGAVLTPQGKIIADFLMIEAPEEDGGGFFLDTPQLVLPHLMQRLMLYKLRAKIDVSDMSDEIAVLVLWDGGKVLEDEGLVFDDPRLVALGQRALVAKADAARLANTDADDWHAVRIAQGVPDGGKDFDYGDAFPHETLMDQLHGISFSKGCYVGQEVVSRMQHRGSARTRIVPIVFPGGIRSEWGVEARAGDKLIGKVGSTANGRGLAMLRLDRVADALATNAEITGGNIPIIVEKPAFATFTFPGEADFGADKG
jgi:tRNA-modifying protein YgfZ